MQRSATTTAFERLHQLDSIMRILGSQLDVSVQRLLAACEAAPD